MPGRRGASGRTKAEVIGLLRTLLLAFALALPAIPAGAEAPAILLAEVYRNQVDVAQYLVSEKLDGVRAIWDGQTLRFRSGRTINAPAWFLAGLPRRPLDGELWMGRGTFERLSGIVRREVPDDGDWRQVRYMIFELPGAPGTFAERAERIRETVRQADVPWLREIEQFRVVDRDSLKKRMREVVKAGGEDGIGAFVLAAVTGEQCFDVGAACGIRSQGGGGDLC